jgi:hypothetical protein
MENLTMSRGIPDVTVVEKMKAKDMSPRHLTNWRPMTILQHQEQSFVN